MTEADASKLKDLLEMGFIQPEEYDDRMRALGFDVPTDCADSSGDNHAQGLSSLSLIASLVAVTHNDGIYSNGYDLPHLGHAGLSVSGSIAGHRDFDDLLTCSNSKPDSVNGNQGDGVASLYNDGASASYGVVDSCACLITPCEGCGKRLMGCLKDEHEEMTGCRDSRYYGRGMETRAEIDPFGVEIKCPVNDCDARFPRRDWVKHRSVCAAYIVVCNCPKVKRDKWKREEAAFERCLEKTPVAKQSLHYEQCHKFRPDFGDVAFPAQRPCILQEQGCTAIVARDQMSTHLLNCPKNEVLCHSPKRLNTYWIVLQSALDVCHATLSRSQVEAHFASTHQPDPEIGEAQLPRRSEAPTDYQTFCMWCEQDVDVRHFDRHASFAMPADGMRKWGMPHLGTGTSESEITDSS